MVLSHAGIINLMYCTLEDPFVQSSVYFQYTFQYRLKFFVAPFVAGVFAALMLCMASHSTWAMERVLMTQTAFIMHTDKSTILVTV